MYTSYFHMLCNNITQLWIGMSRRGLISIIVNINEAWWGMTSWKLKFFGTFFSTIDAKKLMDWSVVSMRKNSEKTDRSVTSRQSGVLKSSTWEGNISLKRWRLENGRVCKYLSDRRRKWDQRYFERLDQIQGFVEGPSSRLYREGDDEE